jgi:hypothetical protein
VSNIRPFNFYENQKRIEIDYELVEKLAKIHCPSEEIANIIGMKPDAFTARYRNDPALKLAVERGRAEGRISLRQKQYDQAMKGDKTMLVWLGKQLLNQSEKVEPEVVPEKCDDPAQYSDDMLERILQSQKEQADDMAERILEPPKEPDGEEQ